MKKVIVLSFGQRTSDSICEAIKRLVGEGINIKGMNVNDDFIDALDKETLLVITSEHIAEFIINKLPPDIEYLVAKRVINYQSIEALIHIPQGSEVLLVNDHEATCQLTIEQLIKHGINHITYRPYFPGEIVPKGVKIAVTPNESHLVPKDVETVIDIGTRQIDIISIFEIAKWLQVAESKINTMSSEFVSDIVVLLKQFNSAAKSALEYKNILQGILDNASDGIIYCDLKGVVIAANRKAEVLFNQKINAEVHSIQELSQGEINLEAIKTKKVLVKIYDVDYLVTAKEIESDYMRIGYYIAFQNVQELVMDSYAIRRQKRKGKHKAIYDFNDIIGENRSLINCINLAKKISNSKSTVLIEGESGTGKELFAQSIHENSQRKSEAFVAINCASLSSTLLESELFGYEKGSFTGAQAQGKAGLFEQAHRGTIFLDEIGDTTLELQSKLLRVLQEKEVRRIGGEKTIPVDIRVIAATNKSLNQLVNEGIFRNDLYYRINVLPVSIPALRERSSDIPVLIEHYLKKLESSSVGIWTFFSKDAHDYLCGYNWPGNVRELINVIEYLVNIKEVSSKIEVGDLPKHIFSKSDNQGVVILSDSQFWVLQVIGRFDGIGRRRIKVLSDEANKGLTEGQIRTIITRLEEKSLVRVHLGQKGAVITPKGIEELL